MSSKDEIDLHCYSGIAFQNKSNAQLRKVRLVFQIMNSAKLVKLNKRLLNIASKLHIPIQNIFCKTIYKHFAGGVSIEDCRPTIDFLASHHINTIPEYAIEGEKGEGLFDETYNEILRTIDHAAQNPNIPFSVLKISTLGSFVTMAKKSDDFPLTDEEESELEQIKQRINTILMHGHKLGVPILIGAEHSWIQSFIDNIVMEMMMKYNKENAIVINTYQMYRYDALSRLKEHHRLAKEGGFKFGLKIVRGAYINIERKRADLFSYDSPIHHNKKATDRDFNEAISYAIENIDDIRFVVATHNKESISLTTSLMNYNKIPANHPNIYFSQLYGMSDYITFYLADHGYNVAKHVPYGDIKVMIPYLMRRAEENSSSKGQANKELWIIEKEIKRRKEKKK